MKEALVTVAAVIVIIGGILFINNQISAKCFDFWPFNGKTCVVSTR